MAMPRIIRYVGEMGKVEERNHHREQPRNSQAAIRVCG